MTGKHSAEFDFFHAVERSEVMQGFVLFREGEMILDIPLPDDTPYDIRGKATGAFFEGRHKERPGDVSVQAKWILLDDTYVGIWIEDRNEYLFKFRLATSED